MGRVANVTDLRQLLERWCDERQRDVMQCMEINADEERLILLWLDNFRAALASEPGA